MSADSSFTSGTDTITLNGAGGNEDITGPNLVSTIIGGSGDDTIVAGTQNDIIDGGAGADDLTGGAGDDVYLFDTGDVDASEAITEAGSGGTDVVSFSADVDFTNMTAASFNEIEQIRFAATSKTGTFTGAQLTGEAIELTETGGGTSKLIITVASGTTSDLSNITNGTGWDLNADRITINGVDGGGETITGPDLKSTIEGKTGDDTITGGSADDLIRGGTGDDILDGGTGTNTLSYSDTAAGTGITIDISNGAQQATGGSGGDTVSNFTKLVGSRNDDVLTGTSTADTIWGEKGDDNINGNGASSGSDTLHGGDGADTITSGGGPATINGGKGGDTLTGTSANETLNGGDDADTITSGGGTDTINGGKGADTITLGTGGQTVKLRGSNDSNYNGDTINNFVIGDDTIDMESNNARIDDSVRTGFSTTTITDSTGLIRDGTTVTQGATATLAQVTANITVGTFDDGDIVASDPSTNADRVYVAWDNGSDTFIGLITSNEGGDGFSGDSLALIATLAGVNDCLSIDSGNFTF